MGTYAHASVIREAFFDSHLGGSIYYKLILDSYLLINSVIGSIALI